MSGINSPNDMTPQNIYNALLEIKTGIQMAQSFSHDNMEKYVEEKLQLYDYEKNENSVEENYSAIPIEPSPITQTGDEIVNTLIGIKSDLVNNFKEDITKVKDDVRAQYTESIKNEIKNTVAFQKSEIEKEMKDLMADFTNRLNKILKKYELPE